MVGACWLRAGDGNLRSMLELLTGEENIHILVQSFFPRSQKETSASS